MQIRSLLLGLAATWTTGAVPEPRPHAASGLTTRDDAGPGSGRYWYEEVRHNGISPFIPDGRNWTVFRNVRDFGAVGDGVHDDAPAIQAAIDYANGTLSRGNSSFGFYGTTGAPAVVYIPAGTYLLRSPIQSYVYTVVMGDPLSAPVLRAAADWPLSAGFVWFGKQPGLNSVVNFYTALKNVVLDSTAVPGAQNVTLLDWSIAQAAQLTNVFFRMAPGGSGHGGVMMPEGGSPLEINDCSFEGGAFGIAMNVQQYQLKGLTFKSG